MLFNSLNLHLRVQPRFFRLLAVYLLDTNILSELMHQQPDSNVLAWVDAQPIVELSITAITVAEIRLGIALLPDGKRKRLLAQLADDMLHEFAGRQFAFDSQAAVHYADIVA